MKALFSFTFVMLLLSAKVFAAEVVLDLQSSSWSHESDSNYAIVIGQVRNISKKSLDHVEAIANFTNSKGELVSTHSSLIDYNPIMPDQTSPFKVMVPWNPQLKNLKMEFKQTMRGKLAHREKKK